MGLLDTEILSNRWDVENSLNNAMNERAMGWGQLDRTAYAPMTASTALQGDMQGQSIGGMLGGQQAEMQKQDIIDNIMANNPDPRTSEELRTVAKQFAEAGLTDYSFQITEVANQLYKTEVEKNTATQKWYDGAGMKLKNNLLTDDILKTYIFQKHGITEAEWNDDTKWSRIEKKDALATAKTDLGGQIDNYANRLMQDNYTKSMLNDLQKNDADYMQHFLQDIGKYGNQDLRDFFQSVMKFDSKDGKNTISISAEYAERLSDDEIQKLDLTQIVSLYDAYDAMGVDNLNKTQKDVYDKLKKYIDDPSQIDASEATIRTHFTKMFPDDPDKVEGLVEEAMKRAGKTYTGNQTSSIPSASNGTMLAMNTQQPEDNYASWVLG
jgi:hypothetical protein